jgi:hypothetical protein
MMVAFPSALADCVNLKYGEGHSGKPNKRSWPATAKDPVSAVRLPAQLTKHIDNWGAKHRAETRSEAIRRLVELRLKSKGK